MALPQAPRRRRVARGLSSLLAVALAAIPAAAQDPAAGIAPTIISLPKQETTLAEAVAALGKQTRFTIDLAAAERTRKLSVEFDKLPYWEAVERIAAETGHRVDLEAEGGHAGKRVVLRPLGKGTSRVSVDGPFRVAVREVGARRSLSADSSDYEVILEVSWEPRFEVFRIDAEPKIEAARDDLGTRLAARSTRVGSPVTGYTTFSTVRLSGLTRKSTTIAELAGSFTVAATPAMLPFAFGDLQPDKPQALERQGVKVTLTGPKKDVKLWKATVALSYPGGGPTFESFEEQLWQRANEFALLAPDGKRYPVRDVDPGAGSIVYRFTEGEDGVPQLPKDLKGWKVEYVTPAPLREFPVRFRLKDVPLP